MGELGEDDLLELLSLSMSIERVQQTHGVRCTKQRARWSSLTKNTVSLQSLDFLFGGVFTGQVEVQGGCTAMSVECKLAGS